MADLVFKSTTRGGRDFFEVTDDGMAYGGKDRYNIKTDESMNYADTVDEVLAELVFDGAWRINYDKIEVDELGIGDEYKEIVKLIRKKYNWLYNLPKGSKGRQFYFDIGRYFRQELKKGTDYGKIFDKVDDVIEKNNNFEESKKMNRKSIKESKTMKKNRMVERFNAPKDWDFEDMLDDYGMEYLQENDSDNAPFEMDMLGEIWNDPLEAVTRTFYGGRYGFDRDSFNPNDSYFRLNGYGNAESIPYLEDYLKDIIDEESFYNWCIDEGYFEIDEDDE